MKAVGYRAFTLALLAVSVKAGADHDVIQVKSPFVVKYPLGPLMEVKGQQDAGHATSFRDSRNANTPRYNRECFSCSTGSFGSSNYDSSGSYSSGFPGSGSYIAPQSTSSRHEVRNEQKYVNGQPIYELHQERKFQDGSLVHEEKVEKDEDDFGVPRGYGTDLQNHAAGNNYGWYSQPGISKTWEGSRHETYGHGGGSGSENHGSDEFSSNFNAEVSRLREQLHRQMGTFRSEPYPAPAASSYRTEVHSQTRYVNGQPVYIKNEEKKYQDGRLVHDKTEEKGAEELGTADLAQRFDSSGAQIGSGGYYERKQYEENQSQYGNSYYPSSSNYNGNFRPAWDSSQAAQSGSHSSVASASQTSSSRQDSLTDNRPTYGSSTQFNQEHRRYSSVPSYSTSYGRNSFDSQRHDYIPSSYPSHRETPNQDSYYSQETRDQPSSHPSYRPSSVASTAHTREESYSGSSSSRSLRPTVEDSTSRSSHESREIQASYPTYRPSSGSPGSHYSQGSWENSSSHSSHRSPSSQDSRENTRKSPSASYPSYRPVSGGSTQLREEHHEHTGSYQYQQPSVGSTTTRNYGETHRASYTPSHRPSLVSSAQGASEETRRASYTPSHRPSLVTSAQGVSEETRRAAYTPSSGSYSSYFVTPQPTDDRRSTSYTEESQSSSQYSARGRQTESQDESSTEDIEETRVLQNARDSSKDERKNYSPEVNMQSFSQESSTDYDQYHRPARPEISRSLSSSHSRSSERSYGSQQYGSHGYPEPVAHTGGGARTVAIDLSTSSKSDSTLTGSSQGAQRYGTETRQSSVYGHGLSSVQGREGELSSSQSLDHHSNPRQPYSGRGHSPVGIPGVISGPQTNHGDGSYNNKERYDISPLDDASPQLPEVGNELDSSLIPTMPSVEGEIDTSNLNPSHSDSLDQNYGPQEDSGEEDDDLDSSSRAQHSRVPSIYSQSAYKYNNTHTVYGTPLNQHSSAADHSFYDYSRSSTDNESHRVYPATSGSSRYHYNETRRHSTMIGGQPNVNPAGSISSSSLSSDCTQVNGCGTGGTLSSRRSEIRTSKRYINGQLVGVTHYERLYENGKLVHENVTEQGVDELTPEQLHRYGIDQLNLAQGSYEPGSYSQRQEVRQEKKYVNGQQVYDLHHERKFEDGQLVHENRTEKDEDDFGVASSHKGSHGAGFSSNLYDEANRHEVTQSQQLQQHVTSERYPGSVGRSSQTHQVADTSRVITKPVYTTRRHETRRQQEYINGQPIYDLHHERRYQNGSLIYENRTELDEKELGGPSGGHHDALQQIMSGNTLNTAYESTYGQNSLSSASGSSYSSDSEGTSSISGGSTAYGGAYKGSGSYSASSSSGTGSYGTSAATRGTGSYGVSSGTRDTGSYGASAATRDTGSYGASAGTSGTGSYGVSSGTKDTGSYGASAATRGTGSYGASAATRGTGSYGASAATRGTGSYVASAGTSGTGSYGVSSGTRGSGSYEESSSSSHESSQTHGSSGLYGTSLLTSGGPSLTHSGGARTTFLGGALGTGTAEDRSSSRHYESSYGGSHESSSAGSGCLTCILLGGSSSNKGSSASHGAVHTYSGSLNGGAGGGYNQRREMNREEHYEDGMLVHGQEEDRSFRDGQLIQENRRQYSEIPGRYANAEEFQSAGTSYTSRSSSGASSHSSAFSSSSEEEQAFGARVTVKGDTTGVCEINPCLNGGTCVSSQRAPICVCAFGFKGTRCEEVYCPRRFCRYGGSCIIEDGKHECSCKSGFSGPRCQIRSRRHASKP